MQTFILIQSNSLFRSINVAVGEHFKMNSQWTRHEALAYVNDLIMVADFGESELSVTHHDATIPTFQERLTLQFHELQVI